MSGPSQESGPSKFLGSHTTWFGRSSLSKGKEWFPTKFDPESFGESKIFMRLLSSPFLKWYEKGNEYNWEYSYFCSLKCSPLVVSNCTFSGSASSDPVIYKLPLSMFDVKQ